MKNLKYIKLYEAFESEKLSKTLKFIKDKESKSEFIEDLKLICQKMDFPFSTLSDDYIEYFPFKKALDKYDNVSDEICKAESPNINGEFCKNGKVKRTWGNGTRMVKCTECNGTGIKKKLSNDVKLVKFWFDKNGTYITRTCVDGLIRNYYTDKDTYKKLSNDINNYNVVKDITKDELFKLQKGSYIITTIDNIKNVIAYVYTEYSSTYLIQDNNGTELSGYQNLSKIAKYHYKIDTDSKLTNISLLKIKKEDEDEKDPYSWNSTFSIRSMKSGKDDIKGDIKEAHFSLILDLSKIRNSEYESTTKTKSERYERKSGSRLMIKDEDVKKENISRYFNKIADKSSVTDNISDLNKLIKRITGGKNILYLLIGTGLISELESICNSYYHLMISDNPEQDKINLIDLNSDIKEYIKTKLKLSSKINDNIKNTKNSLKDDEVSIDILDYIEEISDYIANKIKAIDIQTIEDMEIIVQKLETIKSIFRNSNRYQLNNLTDTFSYIIRYDAVMVADTFKNWNSARIRKIAPVSLPIVKGIIERLF